MLERRLAEFANAYSLHREAEGRRLSEAELLRLPWIRSGPHAWQWRVRSRTYQAFVDRVVDPLFRERGSPLKILDLGAGNGWLSYRMAERGHCGIALDIRGDSIEGLGAGDCFARRHPERFERIVASFDDVPLPDESVDLALFNASLHYATNLPKVLAEASRVTRSGGGIAILDSPFYPSEPDGEAMRAEKQRLSAAMFGERAGSLSALPFIEYLTASRLDAASRGLGLRWDRHKVLYPLGYELRPLLARLRGARRPSRFDLWIAKSA